MPFPVCCLSAPCLWNRMWILNHCPSTMPACLPPCFLPGWSRALTLWDQMIHIKHFLLSISLVMVSYHSNRKAMKIHTTVLLYWGPLFFQLSCSIIKLYHMNLKIVRFHTTVSSRFFSAAKGPMEELWRMVCDTNNSPIYSVAGLVLWYQDIEQYYRSNIFMF